MYLYLPVALTSINILIPVGLGLAVGLLSGLFGVGGGFLMTPLLIMFGIPSTVAAATDSNQIVAASTSGTYAHWKVGNVDFKMGLTSWWAVLWAVSSEFRRSSCFRPWATQIS
jgi:uncharacterized membrane protein YfcA